MIIDEHELTIVDLVDEKQLKQAVDFMSFSNNLLDVALYESAVFSNMDKTVSIKSRLLRLTCSTIVGGISAQKYQAVPTELQKPRQC